MFGSGDPATARHILTFLDKLRTLPCPDAVECTHPLLISDSAPPFALEAWASELNGTLPVLDEFAPALKEWLAKSENAKHRNQFGFIDGQLLFMSVAFEINMIFQGGHNDFLGDTGRLTRYVRGEYLPNQTSGISGLDSAQFLVTIEEINELTGEPILIDMDAFSQMYAPTVARSEMPSAESSSAVQTRHCLACAPPAGTPSWTGSSLKMCWPV